MFFCPNIARFGNRPTTVLQTASAAGKLCHQTSIIAPCGRPTSARTSASPAPYHYNQQHGLLGRSSIGRPLEVPDIAPPKVPYKICPIHLQ
ncbi:hypothetical protein NC653_028484 [Populus alba x Populus x berolinensis]|uniref:Uncharacterized protein n=1 Tax=Populus alba x Populus x berolinensis TaxID=444605 RepID=A0AAD6Q2D0_9ROSI|nr:hypothetical protein NC653_028484 [Populus alba x Populus x berolinensis]